ncbi:MAG: tetratricopeptide repeat protein, partial [Verrucomicrobiota bacterium]
MRDGRSKSEDLLADADRAERAGDPFAAALALRRHLERNPDDAGARLRFARFLIGTGERATARQALERLEALPRTAHEGLRPRIDRFLAELDEADGLLASAAARWERLLADDIDDPEARTRLARLRPTAETAGVPIPGRPDGGETLVSPGGVDALRYRLIREIGRGATATVYLARDEGLDLPVALKVLHPQLAGARQTEALVRFFGGACWRRPCATRASSRSTTSTKRRARWRWSGSRAAPCATGCARTPAACRSPRSNRRRAGCWRRWRSCTRAAS